MPSRLGSELTCTPWERGHTEEGAIFAPPKEGGRDRKPVEKFVSPPEAQFERSSKAQAAEGAKPAATKKRSRSKTPPPPAKVRGPTLESMAQAAQARVDKELAQSNASGKKKLREEAEAAVNELAEYPELLEKATVALAKEKTWSAQLNTALETEKKAHAQTDASLERARKTEKETARLLEEAQQQVKKLEEKQPPVDASSELQQQLEAANKELAEKTKIIEKQQENMVGKDKEHKARAPAPALAP